MVSLFPLLLLSPVLGLSANLVFGRRWGQPWAGIAGSLAAGASFGLAVWEFFLVRSHPEGFVLSLGTWIAAGGLEIPWAFRIDALSATMMLVVTGVGTLIHVYAIGYMHDDPGYVRFFVYMNLFLLAMLVLVAAANYAVLFLGWEGVGLCSYLLIGFWFDRGEGGIGNATAGRKAFVVNRIGDLGFLIAMFLMSREFGTLDFDGVFSRAQMTLAAGAPVATGIALALLIGVTGKSAQFPLFVWLPDAMAGPTPVSALIHAATMVTAGVYLIVRSHALFDLAPSVQLLAASIGAGTALLAAAAAAAQFDIKRVLAYSTISQLGFMVAAAGAGAYTAAIFHLIAHAFFKALLFLAAGSVIHGLGRVKCGVRGAACAAGNPAASFPPHTPHAAPRTSHVQDMRLMGGLRSRMPLTFAVYTTGALALAGLPPLAGFFSKDEILAGTYAYNPAIFFVLLGAAFLTAFYMGRQVWLVFFGTARGPTAQVAAESPRVMTAPLVVLAVLSVVAGGLNLPGSGWLGSFLEHTTGHMMHPAFSPVIAVSATVLALLGAALAYRLYRTLPEDGSDPLERVFALPARGWGLDDFYRVAVIDRFRRLAARLAAGDLRVTAEMENLPVRLIGGMANALRATQTGQLGFNVAGIVIGLIALMLVLEWMR